MTCLHIVVHAGRFAAVRVVCLYLLYRVFNLFITEVDYGYR